MNRHYLITLTPMDWFFFGGERTLDDGKSADYISYSNKFPQQSAHFRHDPLPIAEAAQFTVPISL